LPDCTLPTTIPRRSQAPGRAGSSNAEVSCRQIMDIFIHHIGRHPEVSFQVEPVAVPESPLGFCPLFIPRLVILGVVQSCGLLAGDREKMHEFGCESFYINIPLHSKKLDCLCRILSRGSDVGLRAHLLFTSISAAKFRAACRLQLERSFFYSSIVATIAGNSSNGQSVCNRAFASLAVCPASSRNGKPG